MTMSKNILIIGATSAIAEATARLWAADGAQLYLLARNPTKLQLVAQNLLSRGAQVRFAVLDANDIEQHCAVFEEAFRHYPRVDVVVIAHGVLPDQKNCEGSVQHTLESLQVNAVSTVAMLTVLANRMQVQGSGVIVVIGSVAGDRGRKSNYVYGSAKALLATFLEGLAGRMQQAGVGIINIKPGFVDTPMTSHFQKGLLWAKPEAIARIIQARANAGQSGGFYAPRFWWLIMLVIKHIPSRILYRLNL